MAKAFSCRRMCRFCLRRAHGAHEGADFVGIFLARDALDAGGYIDAGRTGDTQGFADIAGIEPAGQHERHAGRDIFEKIPVEDFAEAARPRRLARRARIEQQLVGDGGIARDRRKVALVSTGIAFITGSLNLALMAATRKGDSLP